MKVLQATVSAALMTALMSTMGPWPAAALSIAALLLILPTSTTYHNKGQLALVAIALFALTTLLIEAPLGSWRTWAIALLMASTLDGLWRPYGDDLGSAIVSGSWLLAIATVLVGLWLWPTSHGALFGPDSAASATLLLAAFGAAIALVLTDQGEDGLPSSPGERDERRRDE